jgi:hypothetical protein
MSVDTTFAHLATVTAKTKRAKTLSGGYTVNLSGIKCWRLTPVDAETRQRPDLRSPHTLYETFFQNGLDIKKGDKLVIDDQEYPIKAVERWPWQMTDLRLRVIVEDMINQ